MLPRCTLYWSVKAAEDQQFTFNTLLLCFFFLETNMLYTEFELPLTKRQTNAAPYCFIQIQERLPRQFVGPEINKKHPKKSNKETWHYGSD